MSASPSHKHLDELLGAVRACWPEHEKTMAKSFGSRSEEVMETSDRLSQQILALSKGADKGMATLAADYRYLCEQIIVPEELFFRRNGRYRLSTFAEAEEQVYANEALMGPYMNGLLMSGVMWSNHADAMNNYIRSFLPGSPKGARHLEIGPGHGLLLYFAAQNPDIAEVHGWDVSATSIEHTRHALELLGVQKPIELQRRNILEEPDARDLGAYDNLVLSEILEHLEDPVTALSSVKRFLKPGGRVWISVPANSPAPDHLYLFESPEHAWEMVTKAGLELSASDAFPMAGTTLEKAKRGKLSISCVLTAVNPG